MKIGQGELHFHPYDRQVIRWFTDSPDAGDRNCICSLCGKLVPEDDCPVRVVKTNPAAIAVALAGPAELEARFHFDCYPLVDPKHFEG